MPTRHGSMGWTLTTNAVKCHQRNLGREVSGTVSVTSTSSRWNGLDERWLRVESRTVERRTRLGRRNSSMETSGKLRSCRSLWRTYDGSGSSTHSFNLLDEELGNVVDADVIWGLYHVTRLMKITARAIGHTIFKWSAVVSILYRFQDRPLIHTQRLKIAHILYRSSRDLVKDDSVRIS